MTKIMLRAVVSLALLVLVSGGPVPEELLEIQPLIREACLKVSGADEDLVIKTANGDFVDDSKVKCYLKCLFDQFRLMNKDGINYDAMLKMAPSNVKSHIRKMVEKCRNTTGTDKCDLAYNATKCFYSVFPDEYFIL